MNKNDLRSASTISPRARPNYWVAGFVCCHIALVACGALLIAPWAGKGVLGNTLALYCDLTGARYSYGFFAPDIPNQTLAVITSVTASGQKTTEVFGAGTGELDHRITTMMSFFTSVDADNLLAASLAAYILGRRPEVAKVEVSLRCYQIPTMPEFRHGKRPLGKEYYQGVFARKAELQTEVTEK